MNLAPTFLENTLSFGLIEKLNLLLDIHGNITTDEGNFHPTRPSRSVFSKGFPKYYINNPSSLIKNAVGSGGVEVINQSSHTVRLSISPSQGDDPGFKSRPEHPLFGKRRPI